MMYCLSVSSPRARKEHICDSCMRKICTNETYSRAFMIDGGESWSFKSHISCANAGRILFDAGLDSDGGYINVCDMDIEDRQLVFEKSPGTYRSVWPNAPELGHELEIKTTSPLTQRSE